MTAQGGSNLFALFHIRNSVPDGKRLKCTTKHKEEIGPKAVEEGGFIQVQGYFLANYKLRLFPCGHQNYDKSVQSSKSSKCL